MPRKQNSESGQTLIIVLLVMVLSLATGIAVSTRSSSTVHQTSNLAVSEQALATAESAMEIMLKQTITSGSNLYNVVYTAGFNVKADLHTACDSAAFPVTPCYKDMGNNSSASVSVITTPLVTDPTSAFEFNLDPGDVQQVWLNNVAAGYSGQVVVCWQKIGEVDSSGVPGAIELRVITGISPDLTINTYAYDPNAARRATNGFTAPTGTGAGLYSNCLAPFAVTNAQAIRIKALYTGTSISIAPAAAQPAIPYQGNVITCTGYSGGSKRTVQVIKTLPQLPALFDYGVYSGGTFTK